MPKTAMELTIKEFQAYPVRRMEDEHQVLERRKRALKTAKSAAELLRRRFGATRVMLFGSLAHSGWFTPWSDIDLAAWKIPAESFYQAVAAITGLDSEFSIDLIDAESVGSLLRQRIDRDGIDL